MAKRGLIILVVLFLVPLASIALILRSETTVLAALEWAIDNLTDYDLELVDPYIDIYAGKAGARQVHLHQDTVYGPAIVSVLNLSGEHIRWRDLLLATLREANLSADAVVIYNSETDEVSDPQPMTWLSYLSWLPRKASINTVHLITRGENVWIFPLKGVSGYRGDYNNFIASANADDEGEPLSLAVELHALRDEDRFVGLEMTGELDALRSGGSGTFSGEIRGTSRDYEYDLEMVANYPSVEDFFAEYQGVGQRLRGDLVIEGKLHGDSESVELNAQSIVLDNMPHYGIEASGTLSRTFDTDDVNIDVISAGEIASLEPLSKLFGVELSGFGRAQASAHISGTLATPQVDEFILATRSTTGLAVNASGRISSSELASGRGLPDNEVSLDISGPDLKRLEPFLGEIPIDPGPWFASAVVTGDASALIFKQVVVEAGTVGGLEIRADGRIDSIDISKTPFNLDQITGIDLIARISSDDTGEVGKLLDLNLPVYHSLDGYLEVRGDGDHLAGTNGKLTASSSDLELVFSAISMEAIRGEEFELRDFTAKMSAELSDTSALSQYTENPAISLGPLSVSTELQQTANGVSAESLSVTVKGESLHIESNGRIGNLVTMDSIELDNRFHGLQTATVLAALIEDFVYPNELGNLVGSYTLSGSLEDLQVKELTLTNMGSDRLAMAIKGSIGDIDELDANIAFQTRVTDETLLQALTGLQLSATDAAGTLKTQGAEVRLEADAKIGRTRLRTDTSFSTGDGKLQSLDTLVTSPHVYLADLGLQADIEGETEYRPAEQIEDAAETGVERVLNRAPRFPSRIRLSFDEITGKYTSIDRLELDLTGRDGAYTVRQLDASYATGSAQFRGVVDLTQDPVAISVAGQGISIPLNRVSADIGLDTDIEGMVSFRGGITGRGAKRDELLQSLDGSLAFALEDAVIEGAAYDVLATGILEWMYSGAALQTSTQLDCTMARFDFDLGNARTENIFIETQKMIATGEATLDLVNSEIDLSLTPRSKSRQVQIPSTVRVRGPMSNPRTIVSPISAAADASAEALVLIPNLAFKLFGIKRDSKKRIRPCEAAIEDAIGSNGP